MHARKKYHALDPPRSSLGCLNGVGGGVQMKTVEFCLDDDTAAAAPLHTSTALKAGHGGQHPLQQQRQQRQQPQPQVPQPAQIRPSCLSRRTSFRLEQKAVAGGIFHFIFEKLPSYLFLNVPCD